jgi:DNA-binding GntR family transcriptional regulator
MAVYKERLETEVKQHREIIAALKSGDGKAGRRAMLTHLRAACEFQVRCVLQEKAGVSAGGQDTEAQA